MRCQLAMLMKTLCKPARVRHRACMVSRAPKTRATKVQGEIEHIKGQTMPLSQGVGVKSKEDNTGMSQEQ
jgi:hypothetical protein